MASDTQLDAEGSLLLRCFSVVLEQLLEASSDMKKEEEKGCERTALRGRRKGWFGGLKFTAC